LTKARNRIGIRWEFPYDASWVNSRKWRFARPSLLGREASRGTETMTNPKSGNEDAPTSGQGEMATNNDGHQANHGRWAWLQSKLSLLILGAVSTGLVVPWLQYTQQTVTWIRENRHSYLMHHLDAAREALKEFSAVHSLVVEAQQRARLAIGSPMKDKTALAKYQSEAQDTRARLSQQVGRFVGTWSYFSEEEQKPLAAAFARYEAAVDALIVQIDERIDREFTASAKSEGRRQTASEVTATWAVVSEETTNAYREVFRLVAQHIRRLEEESLARFSLH
jgi:hypothetical protein